MRRLTSPKSRNNHLHRAIAIVGATSAAVATWSVAGSTTAIAASSNTSTTSSSANSATTEHVVVLLKNQHDNLPASSATVGARVNATNADQAPLIAQAKAN